MENPKVKAAVIKNAGTTEMPTEQTESQKRFQNAVVARAKSTQLPDTLAGDDTCVMNWKVPKGPELFPLEWRLQFSKLYYPNATGGPLHIDMPVTDHEVSACERKEKTLLEKNCTIRYTYIAPHEGLTVVGPRLEKFDAELKKILKKLEKEKKS